MVSGSFIMASARGGAVLRQAAALTVDINGTGDYADMQSTTDAASDRDIVLVAPREYFSRTARAPIRFSKG